MCNQLLKQDINNAIDICSNTYIQKSVYENYSQIPLRGSENCSELFKQVENSFDTTFIVTGSGDQSLETIFHGAKEIYSFDINCLAKYGSALKFAAIMTLEYEEFCDFYKKMFPMYLYNKVREGLSGDYLQFWDSLFDFSFSQDIYYSLFDAKHHSEIIDFCCSIYSKQGYYQVKDRISKVKIQYETIDLLDIKINSDNKEKFDFIYLSNIYYYLKCSPKQYSKFVLSRIFPLLKSEGEAFIHYLYGAAGDPKSILNLLFFDLKEYKKDLEVIKKLDLYLPLERHYLVNCSGYGTSLGDKDVALSLKR